MRLHFSLLLAIIAGTSGQHLTISGLYQGMRMYLQWDFTSVANTNGSWKIVLFRSNNTENDVFVGQIIVEQRDSQDSDHWDMPDEFHEGLPVFFMAQDSSGFTASSWSGPYDFGIPDRLALSRDATLDRDGYNSGTSLDVIGPPNPSPGLGNTVTATDSTGVATTITTTTTRGPSSAAIGTTKACSSSLPDNTNETTSTGDAAVNGLTKAALSGAILGPVISLLTMSMGFVYFKRRNWLRCFCCSASDAETVNEVTEQPQAPTFKSLPIYINDEEGTESIDFPSIERPASLAAAEATTSKPVDESDWLNHSPPDDIRQLHVPATADQFAGSKLRSHPHSFQTITTDSTSSRSDSRRQQVESGRNRQFAHELSTDGGIPTPKAYSGLD
ncbi:uncharacterized protein AB675_852 [Cyphellophora attinorum]|uniref:Mid2 domain-containing protein n=1 Tax=Cyphellophora attinorum TaxID=1664694 RepID=A0A0N0NRY7_9EURO|nr:uncharacterized protein AB675_852 [Phialophora attinorum]KPI45638.1 hypothetical protein AB675_852 [Phialophora attinorum]